MNELTQNYGYNNHSIPKIVWFSQFKEDFGLLLHERIMKYELRICNYNVYTINCSKNRKEDLDSLKTV